MKKKIISAVLLIILCFVYMQTAFAATGTTTFVIDEFDHLTDGELDDLNQLALRIYRETGVGAFFVYTCEEDLANYNIAFLLGGIGDYVIMLENETNWIVFSGGTGARIDTETEDLLRNVYDETDTYVAGVEAYLHAIADRFPNTASTPDRSAPASGENPLSDGTGQLSDAEEYLVFDESDLLTDAEEAALTEKLMSLSHLYRAQIVVATIESMGDGDIDAFVNQVYDSMGFGYGANKDGVFLLVCMNPREYRILSNGFAGTAIDSGDIDDIDGKIVSDLSAGNYAAAFDKFADQCAYYLDGYINGFPFRFGRNLIICSLIGIVAGTVVALILKGQLKTVRKQDHAHGYMVPDSMQITASRDIFLYRNVSRSAKSSSGSSSRSGSSRSTGGGSF